ncbi:hypothetical protein SLA2020_057650 [Shorea laevis]
MEGRWGGCFLWIFFSSVNLCFAAIPYFQYKCVTTDNFTDGSSYQTNLRLLSTQISSTKDFNYGFYNITIGKSPDQVNAIGLCRGDVKQDACKTCLNDSLVELEQTCLNNKEAVGWLDTLCILRYSGRDIFGVKEITPSGWRRSNRNVPNADRFNLVLSSFLNNLSSQAAAGGSLRKYAAGNTSAPNYFDGIYAFVQCTPDLSQPECSDCLATAMGKIPSFCNGKIGCRILQPSCVLRYEISPFLGAVDDIPRPSPPPSSPRTEGKRSNKAPRITIVISASVLSVLLVVLSIWICLRLKKKKRKDKNVDDIIKLESLQYDFATIQAATNNFCDENKLGQGGFGAVYKGQLPNGQDVAVKRLSRGSGQGESEFKNEVVLVANLQHRNLVKLLGFCLKGNERLLIYDFMPNSSLDHFIFDPIKRAQLNWEKRYKIIGGIARGLLYLHEDSQLRVIHRDLKPNNVLLDEEMNPKISDFGMARLFVVDDTHDSTSRVAGTYGYMAPEYVRRGCFSVKSDVFSFGVMLLEILSSRKNNSPSNGEDAANLISLAWRNWRDGTALNVVDPNLRSGSTAQMIRCIHVGLLCVQQNQLQRPTMGSIIVMLTNNSIALPTPSQPAYLLQSTTQSEMSSSNESQQPNNRLALASINGVSISELHPR